MGAYVSRAQCETHYNVTLNCAVKYSDESNTIITAIGDIQKGKFEGDGDVAGVGIFSSFVTVTSFAILLAIIVIFIRTLEWWMNYNLKDAAQRLAKQKAIVKPTASDILEAMIISCSDIQVFTGAAYAITLRYSRGCAITAYHYDIVANMMLLTCATHLISIAIVRDYWRFPWLAALRVITITSLFIVTGLLLSNQNAAVDIKFPTDVPERHSTDSLLFMLAACFQETDSKINQTLDGSSSSQHSSRDATVQGMPDNHIAGWNKYVVILLWYCAANLLEVFKIFRRGSHGSGHRSRLGHWAQKNTLDLISKAFPWCLTTTSSWNKRSGTTPMMASLPSGPGQPIPTRASTPETEVVEPGLRGRKTFRRIGRVLLHLYTICGIAFCTWAMVTSGMYMRSMRSWVKRSGWLAIDERGLDTEDYATSFGQLVPMCMSGLVIFTLLRMISQRITAHKDAKYAQLGQTLDTDASHYDPDARDYDDQAKNTYTQIVTSMAETARAEISAEPPSTSPSPAPPPPVTTQPLPYFSQAQYSTVSPIDETPGEQDPSLGAWDDDVVDRPRYTMGYRIEVVDSNQGL